MMHGTTCLKLKTGVIKYTVIAIGILHNLVGGPALVSPVVKGKR